MAGHELHATRCGKSNDHLEIQMSRVEFLMTDTASFKIWSMSCSIKWRLEISPIRTASIFYLFLHDWWNYKITGKWNDYHSNVMKFWPKRKWNYMNSFDFWFWFRVLYDLLKWYTGIYMILIFHYMPHFIQNLPECPFTFLTHSAGTCR